MKEIEIRCQRFTEIARSVAYDNGLNGHEVLLATQQECDFCKRKRGIGYIYFTENGEARCIWCETLSLFDDKI